MFDIGWPELFIVGLLALIVVGPKDLPRVLKTVMGMIRKVKGMAREFQSGIDDVVREAELDEVRKQVEDESKNLGIADAMGIDELNEIRDLSAEQLEFSQSMDSDKAPTDDDADPDIEAETPAKKDA